MSVVPLQQESLARTGMMNVILRSGCYIFALAMGACAIQYFIYARSSRGLVDIPPYTTARPVSAYLVGIGLVLASLSLASGRKARLSANLMAAAFLLDFLIFHVARIVAHFQSGNLRTRGFETLAMAGTAFLLASAFPFEGPDSRAKRFDAGISAQAGSLMLAASLVIFGIQHFMYSIYVASLIPAWVPGRLFWAYFTGVAFLAAALSIVSGKVTRLSGILWRRCFSLGSRWFMLPGWSTPSTTEISGPACLWP